MEYPCFFFFDEGGVGSILMLPLWYFFKYEKLTCVQVKLILAYTKHLYTCQMRIAI